MAFTAQDPNQQQVPGQLPQAGQSPIAAGGAGAAGSSKATNVPGQTTPQQPSAQLSAYLSANAPQSTAFAGNIASDLAAKTATAGAGINPAVNSYTSNLYSVPTDQNVNAAVASSPSSLTPDQTKTFQNELGAAGKAPNSANTFETTQPYQDVSKNIQDVVGQANLWSGANNPASISAALQPYEQSGQTSGNTTLDALLLSQTPSAYSQIQNAIAPAAGLKGQLDTGAASANAALRSAIAADQAATPAAQGAAQSYAKNLTDYLNQAKATAQNQVTSYNTGLNGLSGQVASYQPQVSALNDAITAYDNMQTQNAATNMLPSISVGSAGFIPPTVAAPSANVLANPEQYADVAALLNLMGSNAPTLPINPSDASLANTYIPPSPPPTASSLLSSYLNPISAGITKANDVYSNNPNNTALANSYSPFADLESAYNNLSTSLGFGSLAGTVPTSPTTGGGSIVVNPNPGTTVTPPANNPAPIQGSMPPPATWPKNPNGTYGTLPPMTAPPTPPVGYGAAQAPDGSWSLYLLPPTHGIGLT